MGDFNDSPFDRSLAHLLMHACAGESHARARSVVLQFDVALLGAGLGTHCFGGAPGWLDQFLANKARLRTTDPLRVVPESVAAMHLPEMRTSLRNPAPRRFGRPATDLARDGFSDHYPIVLTLREE